MDTKRSAGILLHPTSLPHSAGIGTLGKAAYAFVDFLQKSKISLWQVLPLGPTGYGDSPYQSFSTFAVNPLLIDLPLLAERGWASADAIQPPDYIHQEGKVDYGAVVYWKQPLLAACARHFLAAASSADKSLFAAFCQKNSFWLEDYAAFMSIKAFYDAQAAEESERLQKTVCGRWNEYWPASLARHEAQALAEWTLAHQESIDLCKVIQFFAFTQWNELKAYANDRGIAIIGDIPIFVAPDSADVWGNQKLFQLDKAGCPKAVAGVPPDYFSATGQLWGNPLYDWAAMKKEGYRWWISRIKHMLGLTDYVRIDHFRGFEAYWSVPAGSETAVTGEWKKGPGLSLFTAIRKELGELPLIAEDLGVITDGVRALRDKAGLPGMKVLQFAFDTAEFSRGNLVNAFLPHTYSENCVVYTGTHDNDTSQGWLSSLSEETLLLVAAYLTGQQLSLQQALALVHDGQLCQKLIQAAFASVARFAIIPLQDVFALDGSARMNTPSTSGSNWSWRLDEDALTGSRAQTASDRLSLLARLYGRAS